MDNIVYKDFFAYQENFSSIAAGASQTGNVNVQADSDFLLQKLTFFADIGGGVQTANSKVLPLVNIQITDTGSGRQVFEQAIPIASIFGSGDLPFILPTPKLFAARSTITILISNFSAGTTYNIYATLIGQKIFRTGQ